MRISAHSRGRKNWKSPEITPVQTDDILLEVVMRRFSTLSAVAAGALALLLGAYVAQSTHSRATGANVVQAGFMPNTLMSEVNLKSESWDAF
jgi:hypothetical protein